MLLLSTTFRFFMGVGEIMTTKTGLPQSCESPDISGIVTLQANFGRIFCNKSLKSHRTVSTILWPPCRTFKSLPFLKG